MPHLRINIIVRLLILLLNSPAHFWIHKHFKLKKKKSPGPLLTFIFLIILEKCLLSWTLAQGSYCEQGAGRVEA